MHLISDNLTVVRVVGALCILVAGLASSSATTVVKLLSKRYPGIMRYLSFVDHIILALGTGVVISTALMHIMPEGIEMISDVMGGSGDEDSEPYPFGFLFVQISVILIFVVECELHRLVSRAKEVVAKVYILEVSIAVHSILIGISFGTANVEMADVLAIALIFHQLCEGFVIGSVIQKASKSLCNSISLIMTFALSTPFGIVIGVLISQYGDSESREAKLSQGVFTTVAAGLLLYIGTAEFMTTLLHTVGKFGESDHPTDSHNTDIVAGEEKLVVVSEKANSSTRNLLALMEKDQLQVNETKESEAWTPKANEVAATGCADYLSEHQTAARFLMYGNIALGVTIMSVIAIWA